MATRREFVGYFTVKLDDGTPLQIGHERDVHDGGVLGNEYLTDQNGHAVERLGGGRYKVLSDEFGQDFVEGTTDDTEYR